MTPREREPILIDAGDVTLPGFLGLPAEPAGVVVFAHGSGSSRNSPRNRLLADALQAAGFGVVLFDLTSREEEVRRENVFDIGFLAARLGAARRWVGTQVATGGLPVGYLGSSTGAAAALVAAADDPTVGAIVCRRGRPDLAGRALGCVRAPTLLIVGSLDEAVLAVNETAHAALACATALEVVAGAGDLFEEPGAMERVTDLTLGWFEQHLRPRASGHPWVGTGA